MKQFTVRCSAGARRHGALRRGRRCPAAGAANSTKCPLTALKSARKPVEITCGTGCRAPTRPCSRSSSTRSTVAERREGDLVNQIDWEATFQKYKAGLGTGDLPDIVQLQETDQQQMIDTGTVLPASVCAKADKYSFSDFLPRVISYFTCRARSTRCRSTPRVRSSTTTRRRSARPVSIPSKPPTNLAELRTGGGEAEGQRRRGAARAQDRPDLRGAVDGDGEPPVREQRQRPQGTRHQGGVRRRRPGCRSSAG